MMKGANVNWIRDMVIDRTDQLVGDSLWFYKQDKLYVDFSVTMSDSSKFVSFLGNRQIDYMNPVLGEPARKLVQQAHATSVHVMKDAGKRMKSGGARPGRTSYRKRSRTSTIWWTPSSMFRCTIPYIIL